MAEENINKGDYVYSEKFITEGSETDKAYEKHDQDKKDNPSLQLTDFKDRRADAEHQSDGYVYSEEDLDLAIINEVTVTEDDVTIRSLTFRSLLVGSVSYIPISNYINTRLTLHYIILDACCS